MLLELSSAEVKKIIEKKANNIAVKELITPSKEKSDELDSEKAERLLKSIIKYVGDFDLLQKDVDTKDSFSNKDVFRLIGHPNNSSYRNLICRSKSKFNTNVGLAIDHAFCFKHGLVVILNHWNYRNPLELVLPRGNAPFPIDYLLTNENVTADDINSDFIVLHLHDHLRNQRSETFLILRRNDFEGIKDKFKLSCSYDIVEFRNTLTCKLVSA